VDGGGDSKDCNDCACVRTCSAMIQVWLWAEERDGGARDTREVRATKRPLTVGRVCLSTHLDQFQRWPKVMLLFVLQTPCRVHAGFLRFTRQYLREFREFIDARYGEDTVRARVRKVREGGYQSSGGDVADGGGVLRCPGGSGACSGSAMPHPTITGHLHGA
jgi:hypothetical protein